MLSSWPLFVVGGGLLIGGAAAFTYFTVAADGGPIDRLLRGYAARLDHHAGFLLMSCRGTQIAKSQALMSTGLLALFAITGIPAWFVLALLVAAAPPFVLRKRHGARVAQLERQLDTWLLMLANALKATSSVGEAIASTAALVPKPFSEEIDIFVKEIHLGTPLDRAIHALSRRINSTLISGALTAIVVARRTGGNLPQTLERAAAALRETTRLEGVLRSKTAEGRGQVLVLASVPFILGLIILWLDRSWFDPMLDHPVGTAILVACSVAWTFAALWAHQIAKVEL